MPFLGTTLAFDMSRMMHDDQLLHVAHKYGDICALRAFGQDFIIVNSYDVIKEASILKPMVFVDRAFGHRKVFQQNIDFENNGLTANNFSPKIRQFRSSALTIFRDLSVGRTKMENVVSDETKVLMERFSLKHGKSFDSSQIVQMSVTNVLMSILIGKNFEPDDKQFLETMEHSEKAMISFQQFFTVDFIPFSQYLPGLRYHFLNMVNGSWAIINFIFRNAQKVVENSETLDNSFVEMYLKRRNYCEDFCATMDDNTQFDIVSDAMFLIAL